MIRLLTLTLEFVMWLLTGKKKTPEEIENEAKDGVADTSLDTDIDTINDSLRNP